MVEVLDEAREQRTRLAEAAPFITTEELGGFAGEYRKLLSGMDAVVLSGGLPAGLPVDVYASLVSYAAKASVPAMVHAGGPALWHALDRHPGAGAGRVHRGRAGRRGLGLPGWPGGPRRGRGGHGCGLAVLAATAAQGWRAALDDLPGLSLSGEAVVAAAAGRDARLDLAGHAAARRRAGRRGRPGFEVDLDGYDLLAAEVTVALAS